MRPAARGVLWVQAAAQGLAGGLGFALAPTFVFPEATEPITRLAFRLAGYTNITMALVAALLLLRVPDPVVLRALAAICASYHVFAGIEAARCAIGDLPVALVDVGPALAHPMAAAALGWVAALGQAKGSR